MLYDSVCTTLDLMLTTVYVTCRRWVTITLPFSVHIKHSQENLKNKTKKLMRDDV